MNPEEYDAELSKLKEAIPASFSPYLRERICRTLEMQNEYHFGKRLSDLDETLANIGLIRMRSKIRHLIVKNRNYLTHYSDEKEGKVKYGLEMHDLNECMIAVMSVLLLDELCVPREAVREFLHHRPNLRRFLEDKAK